MTYFLGIIIIATIIALVINDMPSRKAPNGVIKVLGAILILFIIFIVLTKTGVTN